MLKTNSILTVKNFDDIQLLVNLRVIIFNREVLFELQNKELILNIELKHNKIWSTNCSDFCFVLFFSGNISNCFPFTLIRLHVLADKARVRAYIKQKGKP